MGIGIDTPGYGSGYGAQPEYTLPGVGPVPVSNQSTTSDKMVEEYRKWLSVISDTMKHTTITADDAQKIQEAINHLADLAKKGDTSTQPPSYMQPEMLEYLQAILMLLQKETGLVPYGQTIDSHTISGLQHLKSYQWNTADGTKATFDSLLSGAIGLSSNKNLIDMLYQDFFMDANAKFNKELEALKDALAATKDIGEILAQIQELRNRMIVAPDDPKWQGDPKNPTAPVILPITAEDLAELSRLAKELENQINALKSPPLNATDEDGSLAASLEKVLDDIKWSMDLANTLAGLEDMKKTNPDGKYPPETEADRKKIWDESGMPWPPVQVPVDEPWNDPYWQDKASEFWQDQWWGGGSITWSNDEASRKATWDFITAFDKWEEPAGGYTAPLKDPWNYPEYFAPAVDAVKDKRTEQAVNGDAGKKMHDWLLDGQDTTGTKSGTYQSDIDKAMNANTNFNTAQEEHLKVVNYNYEQIYKMVAECMQAMDKMVQSSAQAVRGG